MNYFIETLPAFKVLGVIRSFRTDTSMAEIPKFWDDYYRLGYGDIACGQFGICLGSNPDGSFRYLIGNACTEIPQADGTVRYRVQCCEDTDLEAIPPGFELVTIPAHTWLKVPCLGPLPDSIQNAYPLLEKEFPADQWERIPWLDIEEYGKCDEPEDAQKSDYLCHLWVPVKAK